MHYFCTAFHGFLMVHNTKKDVWAVQKIRCLSLSSKFRGKKCPARTDKHRDEEPLDTKATKYDTQLHRCITFHLLSSTALVYISLYIYLLWWFHLLSCLHHWNVSVGLCCMVTDAQTDAKQRKTNLYGTDTETAKQLFDSATHLLLLIWVSGEAA